MSIERNPVAEAELHAWVDGRLPAERVEAVSAWLLSHPDDALRVQNWQAQRLALRDLHQALDDAPVPLALTRAARGRTPWRWPHALVAGVLLVLGYGVGWWQHGLSASASAPVPLARAWPAYVQEARVAHVVYQPEQRHAVEVGADQQLHLVQWLSKRLGKPLRIPLFDGAGFHLVGGRLLPGTQGQARALFLYEDDRGHRVSLHVSVFDDPPASAPTGFQFAQSGELQTFYWIEAPMAYALSGQVSRSTLAQLAEAAYPQLIMR